MIHMTETEKMALQVLLFPVEHPFAAALLAVVVAALLVVAWRKALRVRAARAVRSGLAGLGRRDGKAPEELAAEGLARAYSREILEARSRGVGFDEIAARLSSDPATKDVRGGAIVDGSTLAKAIVDLVSSAAERVKGEPK